MPPSPVRRFLGRLSPAALRESGVMSERLLRVTAMANLVANIGIVVTGGAVRLTGSGLGCPTWPRCTAESLTTTKAMGVHGVIEFGNRTLNGALIVFMLAALLLAYLHRRGLGWAVATLVGIPAQIVWGGLVVLSGLNPWLVGGHFLVSMGIIAAAYGFWRAAGPPSANLPVPRELRWLGGAVVAACLGVLVVGTMVTGSGPHAGDEHARRNGLDPAQIAQVHADLVFLVFGLAIAAWLALRAFGATAGTRAAAILVVVLAAQGLIGFVQYFTHLPVILVGAHMLGAALAWVAALGLGWTLRPGAPANAPAVRLQSAGRSREDNLTVANAAGVPERS
nr:COX15/CtaA family protein [Hamadaea tsunoensis]